MNTPPVKLIPTPALPDFVLPLAISYVPLPTLFTDAEGDDIDITISVSPTASWLSYNPTNGLLEGNPTSNTDAGSYSLTVTGKNILAVTLIGDSVIINFKVLPNAPPTVTGIFEDMIILTRAFFSILVPDDLFTDPEGQELTLSLDVSGDQPTFMEVV